MSDWRGSTALIVVDVQKGFDDQAFWGNRNNPDCEANVARLITAWRDHDWPVVFVRHDSRTPGSPLAVGSPGNAFKDVVIPGCIGGIAVCGIQTNMCCETTARVGSDLGFEMIFVTDATHTFDLVGANHQVYRAREIARYTSLTLNADFGRVVTTAELVN